MSPEFLKTILNDVVCPLFILKVSTDKAVYSISVLLNRSVIFLNGHKVNYNAKTDEFEESYIIISF